MLLGPIPQYGCKRDPPAIHVLKKILNPSSSNWNYLIVQPTVIGKTHIIRVFGTFLKGDHLIIHPILGLTGDQVSQFKEGSDDYGAIEVHCLL